VKLTYKEQIVNWGETWGIGAMFSRKAFYGVGAASAMMRVDIAAGYGMPIFSQKVRAHKGARPTLGGGKNTRESKEF